MNTSRKKQLRRSKIKELKQRTTSTLSEIEHVNELLYKKVKLCYDPETDQQRIYIHTKINDNEMHILGHLRDEYMVYDGINVTMTRRDELMCRKLDPNIPVARELFISMNDSPILFDVLKAYIHSIGDLLDSGYEMDSKDKIPVLNIENAHQWYTDEAVINLIDNISL